MGYTLNPAVITGSLPSMPQISSGATTAYTGINTAPLPQVSSVGGDASSGGLVGMAQQKFSDILNFFGSLLGMAHEDIAAKKQREYNAEQAELAYQRSLDMWNKTNKYNSPAEQLKRLREAGLNPLYYGLDGTSANAFEAQQPLGYERSSGSGVYNPLQSTLELNLKNRLADAQVRNLEAEADLKESQKEGVGLDNTFKQQTLETRVQAEQLANSLTEAQIKEISSRRDKIAAEIRKLSAETENEFEKKLLIQAQTTLANASAQEIAYLLPFRRDLLKAQTTAQKAAASASFYNAMYQKHLIDDGYITEMVNKMKQDIEESKAQTSYYKAQEKGVEASTRAANARAAADEFRNSVITGHVFDWLIEDPDANAFERAGAEFFNAIFNVAGMLTTSLGNILNLGIKF